MTGLLSVFHAVLKPGRQVSLALDCAASEFYNRKKEVYEYRKSGKGIFGREAQIEHLCELVRDFLIDSIEDGMAQNDWTGWNMLTEQIGNRIHLAGDDLLVTIGQYLKKTIRMHAGNAFLIKMNQIGTLTETLEAVQFAQKNGFRLYGVNPFHGS